MMSNDLLISAPGSSFKSDTYQLLEKIGQGGFGQIYKAKQLNTDQIVAIKFLTLNPEFNADKKKRYIERFERETLLSSRLQHPHIVRLLDKGRCDNDLLYAVFEYVDGQSLREVLAESGAMSPTIAAEIMAQILDALSHAHEQGVIHRDIKPGNIMLTKIGLKTHAKILDFGIGTLVNEARQLDFKSITLTQEVLGTPSYSAPEQLRGEPPTPKTDLYVWGLVFIECLTGHPAIFGSNLASIFHKQLSQSNVPLPAALAGHPVTGLLRRVLNKKAIERASSAAEVFKEFSQINFSTLVGKLNSPGTGISAVEDVTRLHQGDDLTILNNNHDLYTDLIERKQITVLCISLTVNSVSENYIDHEVIDALLRDQITQCSDIAIRYGAFHVGTLGDTLIFYFGYPSVSDNDCRLCARTALEISSSLNKRNYLLGHSQGVEILSRMGMHTGLVTTFTDTVPEGGSANIAMELARLASPNQILCSDMSKKLLDNYIEFEPDQVKTIGVFAKELPLHLLTGERQVEAFGFLRGTRRNNAFIGREAELGTLYGLLLRDATSAANTKPRLAHVYGEAGIGKSRLMFELRSQAYDFEQYVAQCLPEHQNNALYPILNLLKYKYSLEALQPSEAVKRLTQAIEGLEFTDKDQATVTLCNWLNLPYEGEVALSILTPELQKQLLFSVLTALLTHQEEFLHQGCLYIFEDMHWVDPTSIEFIKQFIQAPTFTEAKHVFIATSRQVLPDELSDSGFDSLEIDKLNSEKTREFVVALFDNQTVSQNVLEVLLSRTDGIPLFIEELVTMLKQKGLTRRLNGIIDFSSPDKLEKVPNTLRDSLQQKLDTLVYAKETAQLAATIGREFDYDLLVAASNHSDPQVQTDLIELVEAEIVFQQRRVSGDSYIFKHALVRDAAYESMGKEVRAKAHKNIAVNIESEFPDIVENNPAEVARHYAGASIYQKAAEFGTKAIEKQVKSSANDEAILIGDLTLHWAENISDVHIRRQKELKIHSAMLPAVMTLFGYGAKRVSDWGKIVRSLTEKLKDKVQDAEGNKKIDEMHRKSQWTLFLSAHYCSRRNEARQLGELLLKRAQEDKNRQDEMVVLVHLAQAYNIDGDLTLSMATYDKALAIYNEKLDRTLAFEYGMDLKVQALSLSSYNYIHFGLLKEAKTNAYEALAYAEKIGNIGEIVFANIFVALYHIFLKQFDEVHSTWFDFNNKYRDKGIIFHLHFLECYCYSAARETELAAKALRQQLDSGQIFAVGYYVTHLAEAYIEKGQVDLAIDLMESSLHRSEKNGEKSVFPFIKKTLAQCYYSSSQKLTPRIHQLLISSLEDAVSQRAKYFELENSLYYLELMDKDGLDVCDIKEKIATLFTWFHENKQGWDTPLYNKTKKLLNVDYLNGGDGN